MTSIVDVLRHMGARGYQRSPDAPLVFDAALLALESLFGGPLRGEVAVIPRSDESILFLRPPELAACGTLWLPDVASPEALREAVADAHATVGSRLRTDVRILADLGLDAVLDAPLPRAVASLEADGRRLVVAIGVDGDLVLVSVDGADVPDGLGQASAAPEELDARAARAAVAHVAADLVTRGLISTGTGPLDIDLFDSGDSDHAGGPTAVNERPGAHGAPPAAPSDERPPAPLSDDDRQALSEALADDDDDDDDRGAGGAGDGDGGASTVSSNDPRAHANGAAAPNERRHDVHEADDSSGADDVSEEGRGGDDEPGLGDATRVVPPPGPRVSARSGAVALGPAPGLALPPVSDSGAVRPPIAADEEDEGEGRTIKHALPFASPRTAALLDVVEAVDERAASNQWSNEDSRTVGTSDLLKALDSDDATALRDTEQRPAAPLSLLGGLSLPSGLTEAVDRSTAEVDPPQAVAQLLDSADRATAADVDRKKALAAILNADRPTVELRIAALAGTSSSDAPASDAPGADEAPTRIRAPDAVDPRGEDPTRVRGQGGGLSRGVEDFPVLPASSDGLEEMAHTSVNPSLDQARGQAEPASGPPTLPPLPSPMQPRVPPPVSPSPSVAPPAEPMPSPLVSAPLPGASPTSAAPSTAPVTRGLSAPPPTRAEAGSDSGVDTVQRPAVDSGSDVFAERSIEVAIDISADVGAFVDPSAPSEELQSAEREMIQNAAGFDESGDGEATHTEADPKAARPGPAETSTATGADAARAAPGPTANATVGSTEGAEATVSPPHGAEGDDGSDDGVKTRAVFVSEILREIKTRAALSGRGDGGLSAASQPDASVEEAPPARPSREPEHAPDAASPTHTGMGPPSVASAPSFSSSASLASSLLLSSAPALSSEAPVASVSPSPAVSFEAPPPAVSSVSSPPASSSPASSPQDFFGLPSTADEDPLVLEGRAEALEAEARALRGKAASIRASVPPTMVPPAGSASVSPAVAQPAESIAASAPGQGVGSSLPSLASVDVHEVSSHTAVGRGRQVPASLVEDGVSLAAVQAALREGRSRGERSRVEATQLASRELQDLGDMSDDGDVFGSASSATEAATSAGAPRAPTGVVVLVVEDARARERLVKRLAPRVRQLLEAPDVQTALLMPEFARLDALVFVRPRADDRLLAGLARLAEEPVRPRVLVLSSDASLDRVGVIDTRVPLAERAAEVAQQVLDGLSAFGVPLVSEDEA